MGSRQCDRCRNTPAGWISDGSHPHSYSNQNSVIDNLPAAGLSKIWQGASPCLLRTIVITCLINPALKQDAHRDGYVGGFDFGEYQDGRGGSSRWRRLSPSRVSRGSTAGPCKPFIDRIWGFCSAFVLQSGSFHALVPHHLRMAVPCGSLIRQSQKPAERIRSYMQVG